VTHENFDLLITRAGDAYTARVIDSPAGAASTSFRPPFLEVELENLTLRVSRSPRVRRAARSQLGVAKDVGLRLFDAVFNGAVRDCFRASISHVETVRTGLRLRLRLTDVPELAGLPWEFLYDASLDRFLALSTETPVVRYLDLPHAVEPLEVALPMRVLLVVSSPTDFERLDVERECARLTEALADLKEAVQLQRMDVATLGQLQRALSRGTYHVFHFIGHGSLAQSGEGQLIFEDEQERGDAVDASTLGTLLHDHHPLRLAVLNACEGARTSRTDPFSGTAQTLVRQGIPCVVAMQYEISDEAAIRFTHEFYASVVVGLPLDVALAESRKAIFANVSDLEWATPVLYMRSADARIFSPTALSRAPALSPAPVVPSPPVAVPVAAPDAAAPPDLVETRDASQLDLAWTAATFIALTLAMFLIVVAVHRRWFNLVTWDDVATWAAGFGFVTSILVAAVAGLARLIAGHRFSAARVARWITRRSDGRRSPAPLLVLVSCCVVAGVWIWVTPPRIDVTTSDAASDGAAWVQVPRNEEAIRDRIDTEPVRREVSWFIGSGNASDDRRLELRVKPSLAVWPGFIEVRNVDERDVSYDPRRRTDEPIVIGRLAMSGPSERGRLRFSVLSDSAIPIQEKPHHVEIHVRIVGADGSTVAEWCRAVPAEWNGRPPALRALPCTSSN
jgi:hypothetical protein